MVGLCFSYKYLQCSFALSMLFFFLDSLVIKIFSVLNRCSRVNTENRVKLKRELHLFKKFTSNKCFFDFLLIMASDGYRVILAEGVCEIFRLLVYLFLEN